MGKESVTVKCPECGKEFDIPPLAPLGMEPPEDGDEITCTECGSDRR